MALEGELKGIAGAVCGCCGAVLKLQVCCTMAGYYLGYYCDCCGPYSRETGYYRSWGEAEQELKKAVPDNLRTTDFNYRPES